MNISYNVNNYSIAGRLKFRKAPPSTEIPIPLTMYPPDSVLKRVTHATLSSYLISITLKFEQDLNVTLPFSC